jgi:hypothetical protein
MKKLLKVAAAATLLVSFSPSISAEGITSTKIVAAATEQELPAVEKLIILREVAVKYGIPAEILKAIALKENKTLNQYNPDGSPLISGDNGIGLMQLTFTDAEYVKYDVTKEEIMYNTRINIETGAKHLLSKWDTDFLPVVNNQDKDKIEDWYFAVMAYNGLSKQNDPAYSGSKAYQETVFQYIRDYSQLPIGKTPTLDIRYDASKPGIMFFPEGKHYTWPTSTKTTQNYKVGDIAYTYTDGEAAKLRDGVDGPLITRLINYTPVKIVSEPKVSSNIYNHYVTYEVEGTTFEGTMASANLISSKTVDLFSDVGGELQRTITFLQSRDIIDGFADGFRPYQNVTRGQATKLIVESLNLTPPSSDYKLTASDVLPSHPFYEYMRIAESYGIMKGVGGEFQPNRLLTRSEMASILVRAYKDYLENPPASYKYTGAKTTDPNYSNINKLAFNGITNATSFNGNKSLPRGEFARFLERSVDKKEATQQ